MSNPAAPNPFALFQDWLAEAEDTEPNDPNAMTLATVSDTGQPSARMVLLKGVDDRGFVFYTNLASHKGRDLAANPVAALLFHWKSLRRQVRIEGGVERVSDAEADEYFQSRPRDSRIGAWASKQSSPMDGMFELEKRVAKYLVKFPIGEVPRPDFWSGFRVVPDRFEFWRDKPFRLHERTVYQRADGGWQTGHLFP